LCLKAYFGSFHHWNCKRLHKFLKEAKEYYLLTRNDPDLKNDVLYAYDWNVPELRKFFPDRKLYRYFPKQGVLKPDSLNRGTYYLKWPKPHDQHRRS